MRKTVISLFMLLITLPLFTACDIHEWPTPLEIVPVHVKLSYNGKDGKGEYAKWDQWLHTYEGSKVTEEGKGEREDEFVKSGSMRYVLRIYPRTVNRAANRDYIKEIVVTKDISDNYDFDFNLDVLLLEWEKNTQKQPSKEKEYDYKWSHLDCPIHEADTHTL